MLAFEVFVARYLIKQKKKKKIARLIFTQKNSLIAQSPSPVLILWTLTSNCTTLIKRLCDQVAQLLHKKPFLCNNI